MVRTTSSVLACLLPARFGFHKPQEKRAEFVDEDPFRACRDTAVFASRSRANTAPSHLTGDIGESPGPALRYTSPTRQKRSSFTTFFAFSSKKKLNGAPVIHFQGHQTFQLPPDIPSDISPTLVYSRGTSSSHVGHSISQGHALPLHPKLKTSVSTPNLAASAPSIRPRSLTKKRPSTRSKGQKGQERWLSAETWWDALLSPSPRFKARQAPRPHMAASESVHRPAGKPVEVGPSGTLGVTFPPIVAERPRAVSVTSNVRPTVPTLTRSRSAVDLSRPPTYAPRSGFEPALETLADEPSATPDAASSRNSALLSLEPPLSLEQVIDEGHALEEQRAKWKRQATQSIGNKRTRSFSRARSKSLSEKHSRDHGTSESGKVHFNLEVLAARSLLGSQSTMPTVHVVRPSNSSTHSKAHSYSHRSHNSRTYSHSHSHSLTASNSSKSSRNPRNHSRSGSWTGNALLKAGALCGITQDESHSVTDEKIPPSSRTDLQGVIHIVASPPPDAAHMPSSLDVPSDEVGVAISSLPPLEVPKPIASLSPRRRRGDHETRSSPRPSHKSSEFAGPHPSAIEMNLPQLTAANTVSLRHRFPPRAVYPPVSPIEHPYGMTPARPERIGEAKNALFDVTETEHTPNPHISLSHADFGQYGVGEALVYASLPRPVETKPADMVSNPPPFEEPQEESTSCETVVQHEESDTGSMAGFTPPSLTNSTIQMVVSAFNNPDDLDEFQDLFYRPHPVAGDGEGRVGLTVGVELPIDVHSSASSSPLTHLVRKLSEEVHRGSRTPSDSAQRGPPTEGVPGGIMFMGLPRSASPLPMGPGSLPVEGTQRVMVPEDVGSVYTASALEQENDTFGFPIKHGQLEAVIAPPPTRTSVRVSTHPSIAEATTDLQPEPDTEDAPAFDYLSPAPRHPWLPTPDALRSSALTMTSDMSRVSMSGLSDFPLPPSTRPGEEPIHTSVLHAYFDATASESASEIETRSRSDGSEEEERRMSSDVVETSYALRADRVVSCDSRRTFGENEDGTLMTGRHLAESR